MSLPLPDQYLVVWSESFAANLPSEQAGLDEAGARKAVARAMEAGWKAVEDFAAVALLNESRAAALEVDRQKRDKQRAERQRADIVKESALVWREHFGRHVADQLAGKAFEAFAVVSILDLVFAIPVDELDRFEAAVRADGQPLILEDSGRRAPGYRLAGQADRLDAASVEAALEAVDAERKRFLEERDARARQTAQAQAAARQEAEQRNRYGHPVPRE